MQNLLKHITYYTLRNSSNTISLLYISMLQRMTYAKQIPLAIFYQGFPSSCGVWVAWRVKLDNDSDNQYHKWKQNYDTHHAKNITVTALFWFLK